MDEDRSASGESVSRLREALTAQGDIGGALRDVARHDYGFWSALGAAVLRQRFGADVGDQDLPAFIGRIAAARAESGEVFPARQAVQLVCAVLAPETADLDLDVEGWDSLDTIQIILAALLGEWHPDSGRYRRCSLGPPARRPRPTL